MDRKTENSEIFDPGKYYSTSAYTTPAEVREERRYQRKNILLTTLAVTCIIATLFSFVYILFFYNSVVGPGLEHELPGTMENTQTNLHPFSPNAHNLQVSNGGVQLSPPGAQAGHMLNMSNDSETEEAMSVKHIYRKCAPSVVSISSANADFSHYVLGSGIIMSEDGYIITNTHIIDNSGYINVKLYGGSEYPAYLVGEDAASGIAVIKIETKNLAPAEFGDFSTIEAGDEVVAISNPVEGSFTVTDGVISSICGTIKYGGFPVTVFQTNAQCGSGSSGGPVINEYGQVVGIINTDMSKGYELENLSFAVPISVAKPVVDELLDHGYVAGRPALGLELIDIPLSVAAYYGMPMGIFVEKVYRDSDAYEQGITKGDIIVSINGVKISGADELNEVKNALKVGDKVTLGIIRKLERHTVDVELIDSAEMNE